MILKPAIVISKLAALLCVALTIIGCSRDSQEIVILTVGEEALTNGRLNELIKCQWNLQKLKRHSNKKWEQDFWRNVTNTVIAKFRYDSMFKAAAEAKGLPHADEVLVNTIKKKYSRGYLSNAGSFNVLATNMQAVGLLEVFEDNFNSDVRNENYLQTYYVDELSVSPEEIREAIANIGEYNRSIAITNQLLLTVASNAWTLVMSGATDFASAADRFSTDPDKDEGGRCGALEQLDFEEIPECWESVRSLSVGQITPVVMTDYGYFIYRLDADVERDDQGNLVEGEFSRIWIRAALPMEELDEQQMSRKLSQFKRRDVIAALLKEFFSSYEMKVFREDLMTVSDQSNGTD